MHRYDVPHTANAAFYRGGRDVMAIHSGLSVTVCGYLVYTVQDEELMVSSVLVRAMGPNAVMTETTASALRVAADLLALRAQRVLGAGWTIEPWSVASRVG